MTIAVVTGGRNHRITLSECDWLLARLKEHNVTEFRNGDARGVDRHSAIIVNGVKNIRVVNYPANWEKYGKSAGHIRNAEMLEGADILFAFGGGVGTYNCIRQALQKRIPVIKYPNLEAREG